MLRSLVALAAVALLADTPVLPRGPRLPTIVGVGDAQAPVVAVAATALLRAAGSRTAVVVTVAAGSGRLAGASAERTHVTQAQRWTPAEHDDVAIGYRLDRVPAGFADQARVTDAVTRLGALGYPTVRYVTRAPACRAAGA